MDTWSRTPAFGVGVHGTYAGGTSLSQYGTHAHNLVLDRLVRDGAVGLVAWAAVALPLLAASMCRSPRKLLPWLTALIVLNTLDVSLLHSGSYFSALIVAGSAAWPESGVAMSQRCSSGNTLWPRRTT